MVSATVGHHDQRGIQAHVQRLQNQVNGLVCTGAADARLYGETRIATVQRVELLARLQGDIADLEHSADHLGLPTAVQEGNGAVAAWCRVASRLAGLPFFADPDSFLLLRGQLHSVRGKILVCHIRLAVGCLYKTWQKNAGN